MREASNPAIWFYSAITVAGLAVGIAFGWQGQNARAQSGPPSVQIVIDNFAFKPVPITVPVGTQIVWVNRDDIPHTVVSSDDPRAFKSGPLDSDEKFAFVFDRPGAYRYFCSIHPKMQGTVIVK